MTAAIDGTVQTTMEGSDAAAMEARLARMEQMMQQVVLSNSGTPGPAPEPAPAPSPPPEPAPAPKKKATPKKGTPKKTTPKKSPPKDPAPYGHDPAPPEQIKEGEKMLVNPDCNSPFKGQYIKVERVTKDGKVKFIKREKKKDVEKTTQSHYLVIPRPSPSQVQARKAMDHYGLAENDIYLSPDSLYQLMGNHLGKTLEQAKAIFDPCPPPDKDGNFAPDGKTVDWAELTYCNPPFSQWVDFFEKSVEEVQRGKRVIFLMSQLSYFKSSKAVRERLLKWHEQVNVKLISWCDGPLGYVHTLKWGKNVITGKPGGPQFGVVILDMTALEAGGVSVSAPRNCLPNLGELEVTEAEEEQMSVISAEVQRRRRVAFLSEAESQDPPSPTETLDLPSPTDSHTTWGTSMEEATSFTLLEMFCGTGSAGKVVELIPGAKVFSVDINPETMGYHPSKVADILTLDFTKLKFVPDVIWCSPPCQTYSIMGGGKHRTKADMEPKTEAGVRGREMLQKTVDMINYFKRVNLTRPNIIPYLRWL